MKPAIYGKRRYSPSPQYEQSSMQTLKQYGIAYYHGDDFGIGGLFWLTYWQNHGGRIDQAAANDFAKLQNDQTNLDNLATDADKTKLTVQNADVYHRT